MAVSSRHGDEARAAAAEIAARTGRRAFGVQADVRSQASAKASVAATTEALGRLDILVNNAGVGITRWALEVTEADWETVAGMLAHQELNAALPSRGSSPPWP